MMIMLIHEMTCASFLKRHHGFFSNVDILVCTPGRLVDHITSTDGFSLEYLRFLVIDEADRLLSQSYHNWLEKIFDAVYKPSIWNTTHNRHAKYLVLFQMISVLKCPTSIA